MKGCLKFPSPVSSPTVECEHRRKCVAFFAKGSEQVFEEVYIADEWDRTPTEPAHKLTYQDLLELKEIQRSLPRANQLFDPISRKTPSHYLCKVPVGLLPLLPGTPCASQESSVAPSPVYPSSPLRPSSPVDVHSPLSSSSLHSDLCSPSSPRTPHYPHTPPAPTPTPTPCKAIPAHLAHLALSKHAPLPLRSKPKFSFLPFYDTSETSPAASDPPSPTIPSPSASEPEHPLTIASTDSDSNPGSHASTPSHEEPPSPSLELTAEEDTQSSAQASYFPPFPDTASLDQPSREDLEEEMKALRIGTGARIPPSTLSLSHSTPAQIKPTSAPAPSDEFPGFILNGDVDEDFDRLRRSCKQNRAAQPIAPAQEEGGFQGFILNGDVDDDFDRPRSSAAVAAIKGFEVSAGGVVGRGRFSGYAQHQHTHSPLSHHSHSHSHSHHHQFPHPHQHPHQHQHQHQHQIRTHATAERKPYPPSVAVAGVAVGVGTHGRGGVGVSARSSVLISSSLNPSSNH